MRLSSFTIYIIGFSFALIALSYAGFMHYLPEEQTASNYREGTEKLTAEAAKQRKADERVAQAIAMIKAKKLEWAAIAGTRTPPDNLRDGGVNLNVPAFQLTVDTRTYRNSLQRAVNAQLRKGGVEVINGPYVPGIDPNAQATSVLASFYHYPDLGFPAVILDLGTVTIQGTYAQIMNHIRAYKTMPHYLAVTDGLQITGTSPHLAATYNLTLVGFLRSKIINGQAPEGSSSGGGGGGSFGGPPRAGGPPGVMGSGGPPGVMGSGGMPGGGMPGGKMGSGAAGAG